MAGKLIVHNVLHGGPGMAGLSPVVIKYLVTGSIDEAKEYIDHNYDVVKRICCVPCTCYVCVCM